MCAVTVIVSSVAALVAIVLLARWEAWWRDERARRDESLQVDDQMLAGKDEAESGDEPCFEVEPDEADHDDPGPDEPPFGHSGVPQGRDHDPERGVRAHVTVDAIKERISREKAEAARRAATEHTAPLPRLPAELRPSPYPRGGRRAAED